MPKTVNPPAGPIWRLVGRAQRIGLSEGLRGRGGAWLAVGVGAWGLQRVRAMAVKEDEILLREPLGPGETMTIRHETLTQGEAARRRKQRRKERARREEQVAVVAEAARVEARRRRRPGRRR